MEDCRTFKGRTRSPATGRGHEVLPDGTARELALRPKATQSLPLPSTVEGSTPPQKPVPVGKPVPTVADLTAQLDALEQEYRQRLAVAMGTVNVHGTVPGSGTMRRAGEVFAMRPVTRDGMTYEEQ